jgi:hypothetical protein
MYTDELPSSFVENEKKTRMCNMEKPRQWIGLVCVLIIGAWLAGCSRDSFSSYTDFDTVITAYHPDYEGEFAKNRTFAMPEEVFDLSDFVNDPIDLDPKYNQLVLDTVADNMAEFGYDRLAIEGDPFEMETEADVIVYVGAVAQEDWVYGTTYNYWYGWYWYYPVSGVSVNFDNGTIVIAMVDPDLAYEQEDREILPVVWSGGLRGLLGYHSSSEIVAGVDKAFDQSQYLRVGDPVASKPGLGAPDAGSN